MLEESGKPDDAAARRACDAMADAHNQMFETRLEACMRIDAVLTPEQLRRGWRGGCGGR